MLSYLNAVMGDVLDNSPNLLNYLKFFFLDYG